jgi:hypothetical protein
MWIISFTILSASKGGYGLSRLWVGRRLYLITTLRRKCTTLTRRHTTLKHMLRFHRPTTLKPFWLWFHTTLLQHHQTILRRIHPTRQRCLTALLRLLTKLPRRQTTSQLMLPRGTTLKSLRLPITLLQRRCPILPQLHPMQILLLITMLQLQLLTTPLRHHTNPFMRYRSVLSWLIL